MREFGLNNAKCRYEVSDDRKSIIMDFDRMPLTELLFVREIGVMENLVTIGSTVERFSHNACDTLRGSTDGALVSGVYPYIAPTYTSVQAYGVDRLTAKVKAMELNGWHKSTGDVVMSHDGKLPIWMIQMEKQNV